MQYLMSQKKGKEGLQLLDIFWKEFLSFFLFEKEAFMPTDICKIILCMHTGSQDVRNEKIIQRRLDVTSSSRSLGYGFYCSDT